MVTGVMLGCGIGTMISALGVFCTGALSAPRAWAVPTVSNIRPRRRDGEDHEIPRRGHDRDGDRRHCAVRAVPPARQAAPLLPPIVVGTLLVVTSETLI